jgi:xanthine dehydrogenase accessory factor
MTPSPLFDDLDPVLDAARGWLRAGHRVAIATVAKTWGSAPRRIGAHLVVRDDGHFEGSVSGGCVEGDVVTEALALVQNGGFKVLDYGVADARAWEVGLACGGRISVLLQSIDAAHFPPSLLDELANLRQNGTGATLATDLATGATTLAPADTHIMPGSDGVFLNRYEPPLRIAIIGAVHIAQTLVPLARLIGHAPSVIDPRGLFSSEARFAGVGVDPRWPDEALAEWQPNSASAVVALSHDPKLDDLALIAALRSPAYYIAALGSRKNHANRLERLAAAGFTAADLARVHGPAGLDIGAANPAEIALSIAAQMTAAWRGRL